MPKIDRPAKSLASYDIVGLYAAGSRFSDWTAEDAVEEYLKLHPEADEAKVRDELEKALAAHA